MRSFISAVILVTAVTGAIVQEVAKVAHLPRVKRVIGGVPEVPGSAPFLVHLRGKIPSRTWWGIPLAYKNYYCGGSIINKRWIATAAHCFAVPGAPSRITTPKYWHIKAGELEKSHDVMDKLKHYVGSWFGRPEWLLWYVHASKIVKHPNFNPADTWKHDIAMVKLDRDLPVGGSDPNIGVATLPGSDVGTWPEEDTQCYMKGWGCTDNGGTLSETAQTVELPAKASLACDITFGTISETRLCAGHNLASKGICRGDSGGPLVCKKNDTWVQAGLASYTSASSPGDVPGVFTRMSYYIDWIEEVIRNN